MDMSNQYLLYGYENGTVELQDILNKTFVQTFYLGKPIISVMILKNQHYIIVSAENMNPVMYHITTGNIVVEFVGHDEFSSVLSMDVNDCKIDPSQINIEQIES